MFKYDITDVSQAHALPLPWLLHINILIINCSCFNMTFNDNGKIVHVLQVQLMMLVKKIAKIASFTMNKYNSNQNKFMKVYVCVSLWVTSWVGIWMNQSLGKHTWALKVIHTMTRSVFKAAQILWHHSVSFFLLLILIVFGKESGSQIRAQCAGHEVHRRDGGLGHVWTALHVPN